jgi:hypothetical protein
MIYDAGLPLNLFSHPAVQAFLHRLRPAYDPPSRQRLSSILLNESYQSTKVKVEQYLNTQDNLCISFDESSDIPSNRIMNVAVITERGAFYDQNIDIRTAKVSTEFCIKQITKRAQDIVKGRMNRIGSISTDTCNTMLKTAQLLQSLPSFQHTLMVPCDPYGLELLIHDICNHSTHQKIIKQADEIVAHFKGAKKQYQILKELQRELCPNKQGKASALIMRGKTR